MSLANSLESDSAIKNFQILLQLQKLSWDINNRKKKRAFVVRLFGGRKYK